MPAPLHRCMALAVLASAAAWPLIAHTQNTDAPEWQENTPPAPPAFDAHQVITFEAGTSSELSYGISPDSVTLDTDGVIRYVMVASSRQGALNASFDGLHCASAQVKTYARWNSTTHQWNSIEQAQWRSLYAGYAVRPALMLARQALCEGPTPNGPVNKILRDLRTGRGR